MHNEIYILANKYLLSPCTNDPPQTPGTKLTNQGSGVFSNPFRIGAVWLIVPPCRPLRLDPQTCCTPRAHVDGATVVGGNVGLSDVGATVVEPGARVVGGNVGLSVVGATVVVPGARVVGATVVGLGVTGARVGAGDTVKATAATVTELALVSRVCRNRQSSILARCCG